MPCTYNEAFLAPCTAIFCATILSFIFKFKHYLSLSTLIEFVVPTHQFALTSKSNISDRLLTGVGLAFK